VLKQHHCALFKATAALMHAGQWQGALDGLDLEAEETLCSDRLLCLAARCQIRLGHYALALKTAEQATHLAPESLYAQLLLAQAWRMLGKLPQALALTAQLFHRHPAQPKVRQQLADLLTKVGGDWSLADKLMRILVAHPGMQREVAAFGIKQKQYNLAGHCAVLSRDIERFAARYLTLPLAPQCPPMGAPGAASGRKRIGLVSTLFRFSPVYFLCYGALQLLAQDYDLVFFSRDPLQDRGTQAFKAIATEWHPVQMLSADELARCLRRAALHAVVDMCGWLDVQVLKALSCRPVARQYKWVGGQACTTGLKAFDGFITDAHQSPPGYGGLYTEPLLFMPGGYVSYTAPDYLPAPRLPGSGRAGRVVGIISHPIKVSEPFLTYLRAQIEQHERDGGASVTVQFIGWRYGENATQKRIARALGLGESPYAAKVRVEFVATQGHEAFLQSVAALDWVIDTFPYTCGLTALEALAVGVPLRTEPGHHFNQRHGYSHARHAGLADEQILLSRLGALGEPVLEKNGRSLLPMNSARLDHAGLAHSLAKVLETAPGARADAQLQKRPA
jgi:protein O-GlcNAc transferase